METFRSILDAFAIGVTVGITVRFIHALTLAIQRKEMVWRHQAMLLNLKVQRRVAHAKMVTDTLQGKTVNAPAEKFSSPGFYPNEPMSARDELKLSDFIAEYDYTLKTPLSAFRELTRDEQVEMFGKLVHQLSEINPVRDLRFRNDDVDEVLCYIESIMTRLGFYADTEEK